MLKYVVGFTNSESETDYTYDDFESAQMKCRMLYIEDYKDNIYSDYVYEVRTYEVHDDERKLVSRFTNCDLMFLELYQDEEIDQMYEDCVKYFKTK